MANCGATGTALDRAVAAATSGGGGASKQAVASLVGHASMGNHVASMPMAPPTVLSTTMPTTAMHPSPELHQRPMLLAGFQHYPVVNNMRSNLHHQPAALQQHSMAMQQHQLMMMHQQQQQMAMMQQQQQQQHMLLMQQQQQQQQDLQGQENTAHVEDDVETQHASNKKNPTIEDWHEGLEEEAAAHEGRVQGATIEELAAAWAQAEAEYEDAVNMGAVYQQGQDASEVFPYDFETTAEQLSGVDTHKDWMKEAQDLFDRGEISSAIRCCETELQLNNEHNAKAWYLLGKCHAEQDEDTKAIACLERSVEMDPYSPPALLALGVSHVNELNHGRALLYLQNWMTHNPKYAGLDIPNATEDVYGDASTSKKETAFEEAQRLLLCALEHDPMDAQVHEALGVVYNVSRDYDAAISSFQKALELTTNDKYSLFNKLGATLANANRSDEALPHYHSALQLRPKYARAWLNMAISHSNLKNYDEAARCYLQTLSLNPSARHCWSYLRIALSCSEKWDLIPLAAKQDLSAFSQYYDFVQY